MPIASYGGLIVDSGNFRSYPGSGGYVGAFSPEGSGNYGVLGGAGKSYEVFTPANSVESPIDNPQIPGDLPGRQRWPGDTVDLPPVDPVPTGGGGGGTPTPTTTTTPGSGLPNPFKWFDLESLMRAAPRTSIDARGPSYMFNPGSGSSGGNMNKILLLLIVAAVAFWAYKKYA